MLSFFFCGVLHYSYLWAFAMAKQRWREKNGGGGGTFDRVALTKSEIHKHEIREYRSGRRRRKKEKGQEKESVWEQAKDIYCIRKVVSHWQALTLFRKPTNQCSGTAGQTHINLRGTVCDGGEDVLLVCVLQENVCLKFRARQESWGAPFAAKPH